jgi:hypothetical protein
LKNEKARAGARERRNAYFFFFGVLQGWNVCRWTSIPKRREHSHKESMKMSGFDEVWGSSDGLW